MTTDAPASDYANLERAIKAECDALAGEPGFCFWPRCDCETVPAAIIQRRRQPRQETY